MGGQTQRKRRRRIGLAFVLVLLVPSAILVQAGSAPAERSQRGNLISSLNGEISPLVLPRNRPAPIAVHLVGNLETADGSSLPQVTRIEVGLPGGGKVVTRGLPLCSRSRLLHTRDFEAIEACGPAYVGHGTLDAQVVLPNQEPFRIHAHLLVFNSRARGGGVNLLVHAFVADPPGSVVVPFHLRHPHGTFQNVLVSRLPRFLGSWPHFTSFDMTLWRRYRYRGQRLSFLTASCPVPGSFTAGFISFARASYRFDDGRGVSTEAVRGCRAR